MHFSSAVGLALYALSGTTFANPTQDKKVTQQNAKYFSAVYCDDGNGNYSPDVVEKLCKQTCSCNPARCNSDWVNYGTNPLTSPPNRPYCSFLDNICPGAFRDITKACRNAGLVPEVSRQAAPTTPQPAPGPQ